MPRMPGMAGRQPATVGVEGQPAAAPEVALGDERPALALRPQKPEALEQQQHGDREAVVELDGVDVGRRQAGLGEGGRTAARPPPVSVKSGIWLMFQWVWAPAAPST